METSSPLSGMRMLVQARAASRSARHYRLYCYFLGTSMFPGCFRYLIVIFVLVCAHETPRITSSASMHAAAALLVPGYWYAAPNKGYDTI